MVKVNKYSEIYLHCKRDEISSRAVKLYDLGHSISKINIKLYNDFHKFTDFTRDEIAHLATTAIYRHVCSQNERGFK